MSRSPRGPDGASATRVFLNSITGLKLKNSFSWCLVNSAACVHSDKSMIIHFKYEKQPVCVWDVDVCAFVVLHEGQFSSKPRLSRHEPHLCSALPPYFTGIFCLYWFKNIASMSMINLISLWKFLCPLSLIMDRCNFYK